MNTFTLLKSSKNFNGSLINIINLTLVKVLLILTQHAKNAIGKLNSTQNTNEVAV